MDLRTNLGRARGLGSAKDGTHHWWMQRVTAITNIPLVIWFVFSIIAVAGQDYAAVKAYYASPLQGSLLLFFVLNIAYHMYLGVTVIFEDYIHVAWFKYFKLIAMHIFVTFTTILCVVSILKIVFGG